MSSILEQLNGLQLYIILGLIAFVIILFIMNIVTLASLSRIEKKYRKLTRGVNNKNLEELITGYLDHVDEVKEQTEEMKEFCKSIDGRLNNSIQKYSIKRYRAFEDVGSDLSFSIALLNDKNDGFIITGIYGRNESTTYAKPIDKGISRYELSEEEKNVLEDALTKR